MNPNYAPHDYSKAPSPTAKKHRATLTPAQELLDEQARYTNKTGRHSK